MSPVLSHLPDTFFLFVPVLLFTLLLSHVFIAAFAAGFVHFKLILALAAAQRKLSVLERSVKPSKEKAHINNTDRWFFGWVHKRFPSLIPEAFFPSVKVETIVKWGKKWQARLWLTDCLEKNPKSSERGRPPITDEHIAFMQQMDLENPEWGNKKMADELALKCGIKHAPSTVGKYRESKKHRTGPKPRNGQRFRTFVKNHSPVTFACDFLCQFVGLGRRYFVYTIIHLETRRIVHWNVTEHPSLPWVQQQIREATADFKPRFFIHDNDGIFGQVAPRHRPKRKKGVRTYRCSLDRWLDQALNIRGIPTPYMAPNANAYSERLNRTLREQCLDHFIFFNEQQLRRVLAKYIEYYNRARPHQGINAIPDPYDEIATPPADEGRLVSIPVLGGLHHDYRRAS